jgi:uncharacterized protein
MSILIERSVRKMAEETTILRVPAGSNVHGLAVPGTDDQDELGVCVENIEDAIGFNSFEQYIFRTATERTGQHDAPSQPGDLDLTIYSLRKFLRLALQGNPQIIQTFFVPASQTIVHTSLGGQLKELAPLIVSKQAGSRYLGYLESQKQRLMGERGQKKINRPELEEKYGYDTKYAMHILRLGFQGRELLSTGRVTLPMPSDEQTFTYATRRGQIPLQDVLTRAGELERDIKDLISDGPMQPYPNREAVQSWMVNVYNERWKCNSATLSLINTPEGSFLG